ncbi:hypothetical protein L6452_32238 [Arctium lappa]|uniref:Uncharacterized protein n=1 Tax=Arctium lappa TaxID=4217 RepID=A0ACB8Z4E1_ARCLA|nr:hypothetical protein L6452_32238 [Arctium lappa]
MIGSHPNQIIHGYVESSLEMYPTQRPPSLSLHLPSFGRPGLAPSVGFLSLAQPHQLRAISLDVPRLPTFIAYPRRSGGAILAQVIPPTTFETFGSAGERFGVARPEMFTPVFGAPLCLVPWFHAPPPVEGFG